MRLAWFRGAAFLVAVTAVTALTGCTQGATSQLIRTGYLPRATFVRQAQALTTRWDRSALARSYHRYGTGLVLVGGTTLLQVPRNAKFASRAEQEMFTSGRFRLGVSLPSGSPADVVRWDNFGTTAKLPVENARTAFAALATRTPCRGPVPCDQLGDLTVTGMRPAIADVLSSGGPVEVPAWQFSLAQVPWTFTRLAVVPGALEFRPGYPGWTPSLVAVSADGRTLTLNVFGGGCGGQPRPRASAQSFETASTVVVDISATSRREPPSLACAGVGMTFKAQVRLRSPIGTRVVLDVQTGWPLQDLRRADDAMLRR